MPALLDQRVRALSALFEALPDELEIWRTLASDGGEFEKHHSQIAALSAQMLALNERVQADWGGNADFIEVRRAELRCTAVQSVWNYFREKLLLRRDSFLGSTLKVADYYVWACYKPVAEARREADSPEAYRKPPLVAFHGDISPWALSRETSYEVENDAAGVMREAAFEKVRRELPIAIIGIPWQTAQYLPNLALLAHETGHIVESDFSLEEAIADGLAEALRDSPWREGWSNHWRKEVFADLFACFTAGPSFVQALIAALPESPATVRSKRRPSVSGEPTWGSYPPGGLRVMLNLKAIEIQGFASEAGTIREIWLSDYPEHAMVEAEKDLPKVVGAVERAAQFRPELKYPSSSESTARFATRQGVLKVNEPFDPRVLISVAGSFPESWDRIRQHLVESRPPEMLAGTNGSSQATEPAPPLNTERLADLLFTEIDRSVEQG
jgi:hypothetical protein